MMLLDGVGVSDDFDIGGIGAEFNSFCVVRLVVVLAV